MIADLRSDNTAGVHPDILAALARANAGTASAYGDDAITESLTARFAAVFEHEVAVFPVGTGTAANALALSALAQPWSVVYAHEHAHVRLDECGAPELLTGGARLAGLPGASGKLDLAAYAAVVAAGAPHPPHGMPPAAVTISQTTEVGTIYTAADIAAIAGVGLPVHMDGARFANACVALNVSPADLTWRAGVSVLSLGATKNGAMAAEAVVFFDRDRATDFAYRRKRAGHLFSKMRFVSAQLAAYLAGDLWLTNARHANAQAARLASGLGVIPGASVLVPAEANEVFVRLPEPVLAGLEGQGHRFYRWDHVLGPGAVRLVTAWDTAPDAIDTFIAAAGALSRKGSRA